MLQHYRSSRRTAAIVSMVSLLGFSASAAADCHTAAPVGRDGHPKLFMTSAQLGVAIACARPELVAELKSSAAALYAANWDKGAKLEVVGIDNDPGEFYDYANGLDYTSSGQGNRQVLTTKPGDARLALRLATAAFFVDATTAGKYRDLVRLILLHWARHTMVDTAANRLAAFNDGQRFGLIVGSPSTAFGAAYDLLVAGGGMPVAGDRADMVKWFKDIGYLITESNNYWYDDCRSGAPFDWGISCVRARGDNHISVGTAAIYVAGVLSGDATHKAKALRNTEPGLNWGYKDRLTTVIHKGQEGGSPLNPHDQFRNADGNIFVNTGEIYDRWRGHFLEQGARAALQLHRSTEYPFLNMSFLIVQALAAKRQGVDLRGPHYRPDGDPISLGRAVTYYSHYLRLYNLGEPFTNKTGYRSEPNYASFGYCFDRNLPNPYAQCPAELIQPGLNDEGFTYNYYHLAYAGAKYLYRGYTAEDTESKIDPTVTPAKMAPVGFPYSGHIVPFEPALYLERAQ